jgi:hypothetical protein
MSTEPERAGSDKDAIVLVGQELTSGRNAFRTADRYTSNRVDRGFVESKFGWPVDSFARSILRRRQIGGCRVRSVTDIWMTAVGGRVERLQEFHMPVDCERCQPVMRNPVGIAASTVDCVSTLDTDAPEGPRQKRSIIVDIAVSGPAIKAATDPSSSLRTQPAKPSRVASSRVHTRKLTP